MLFRDKRATLITVIIGKFRMDKVDLLSMTNQSLTKLRRKVSVTFPSAPRNIDSLHSHLSKPMTTFPPKLKRNRVYTIISISMISVKKNMRAHF